MGSSPTRIAVQVTEWYQKHSRQLPWRKTRDPYAIWISEVMLQQTQVGTVIPYYNRFLSQLPTVSALAKASEEKVLKLWAGLGYYSRAKNLRKGAQYLLKNHGGLFPKTREELLRVPGIGPYTAGALLSIAFRLKEPLVDGNVERVLSRFFAFSEPLPSSRASRFFWAKAREWVEASQRPHWFNQGLMEIGSLVCTRTSPLCGQCPLQSDCLALKEGRVEQLPVKKAKPPIKDSHFVKLIFTRRERYWLAKNKNTQWWAGLWDFPEYPLKKDQSLEKELAPLLKTVRTSFWKELQHQKHTVTRNKLNVVPVLLHTQQNPPFPGKWLTLQQIQAMPVSALVKKILLEDF